jgi:NADH:ubiquinone oxidoreductase subunit 2 (subunit N)
VSQLPFLMVTIVAATLCLVARRRPQLEVPVGLGGLAVATVAALVIAPGDVLRLGSGEVLLATAYGRLFLLLGAGLGLVLGVVALMTSWQPNLPAAMLVGLAGMGLGLSLTDPLIALLVLLGSAVAVALVSLDASVSAAGVRVVVRQVRTIALAGVLAYVAVAWAAPALSGIGSDPAAFGLADLAIVLAVALRFGAVPFHRPVARLTDTAPGLAIPLVLVWGPAALAVVVLGATDGSAMTFLVPSGIGQAVIVAVAGASLVLGAVGAWLQDDLEHVLGYSIIQDAGFVLLGLAIGGPDAHEPARVWLLIMLTTKTAFAAWVTVVEARFRTGRLPELHGWARRSPLLAIALVGIVVATIGAPGLLAWSVRASLVQGAAGGPLQAILLLAGLASLVYYARIGLVGLGRPSLLVAAAPTDRPVAAARTGTAIEAVQAGWRTNRAPIAAGFVLVLVLVSLVVATGGLGGPDAARAAAPEPSLPALGQ